MKPHLGGYGWLQRSESNSALTYCLPGCVDMCVCVHMYTSKAETCVKEATIEKLCTVLHDSLGQELNNPLHSCTLFCGQRLGPGAMATSSLDHTASSLWSSVPSVY